MSSTPTSGAESAAAQNLSLRIMRATVTACTDLRALREHDDATIQAECRRRIEEIYAEVIADHGPDAGERIWQEAAVLNQQLMGIVERYWKGELR